MPHTHDILRMISVDLENVWHRFIILNTSIYLLTVLWVSNLSWAYVSGSSIGVTHVPSSSIC